MHGYSPEINGLVNVAVDSMGGVVNNKGGLSTDLSPQQTVIEDTKVELRQHYGCYEEARRQLEFLEQGGDPLDFRPSNAASLSVQSTSLTDQHPELFVISEAKGSFALAASPPGDSVESSGRPGAPPAYEPNSADNLMLFDGENDMFKGKRSLQRSSRNMVGLDDQSSLLDKSILVKEIGDSAYGLPKKAYKRRNRSRPSRDGARSSSTDVVMSSSVHTAVASRHVTKEVNGLAVDADNQDHIVSLNTNLKPTSLNCSIVPKVEPSKRLDKESDSGKALESTSAQTKGGPFEAHTDHNASKNMHGSQHKELLESDSPRARNNIVLLKPESYVESEQVSLEGKECVPSLAIAVVEDQDTCSLTNGFSKNIGDSKGPLNEVEYEIAVCGTKSLNLETSGNQPGLQLNENGNNCKSVNSNGYTEKGTVSTQGKLNLEVVKSAEEISRTKIDTVHVANANSNSIHSDQANGPLSIDEETLNEKISVSHSKGESPIVNEGKESVGITSLKNERISSELLDINPPHENEFTHTGRLHCYVDSAVPEISDTKFPARDSAISPEKQTCSQDLKLEKKAHEDALLEEARIIEAKRKRITELSVHTSRLESRPKSHWAYVLEEMAWLANDFAQERLWKISAAAQIGCQASSAARSKLEDQDIYVMQKQVARSLAKAVMNFWCSVEERSKNQEFQKPGPDFRHAVMGYATRFLKYNGCNVQYVQSEVALTPDSMSNIQIMNRSRKDYLTEENLFYPVPAGAMHTYRKSIESQVLQWEKTGIFLQEEVETSGYDTFAEYGTQETAFEEDEETNTCYLPGAFVNSNSYKLAQNNKKQLMKDFAARSYEVGSDSPFMQSNEIKSGNYQPVLIGKRPSNTTASIPTKRVRTASRQRILIGTHGCLQAPSKTDVSSGDTNSFQEDQNDLQAGSHIPNNMEVESVHNLDRQLPFDSELSHHPKKKKAKKVLNTYEHNWRSDSNFQNEQRDNFKRKLESHQFESNGSSGLYSHHIGKKLKLIKQSPNNTVDNVAPVNGSISSPAASQMSNMSNPSKFMRMLGGRDRGRKTKGLKTTSGQLGSASSWSLFEDQALVVLVHDMGLNWDLVSDAFNDSMKFKCIFRTPKECKERHKVLMDSPAGEGADSADDSGSSQPYRSTLPGIPKGSARQLFQRLQGHKEEDTIKSHLEKAVVVGKKQHHRRAQDPRHLQQPHNSHTLALSQVCPNNLNGAPLLTPLDLGDATTSSPDLLPLGYQSPNASGLPNSNQGSVAPMLPASPSAVPGSNLSSTSSQINVSVRDGRSGIPRSASASLSTDEQQRLQQYNQMASGKNFQQANVPVSGVHSGNDRGVRMLANGNGVGISSGLNRSIPMPRPGFQGIASSSMIGPGSVLSSGMMAVANTVNNQSGPGQGNPMMRPRDPMHTVRPTKNAEHQRQVMNMELQMQVSQGTSQGISPFGGLNSSFSNQTTTPSVPSYPLHHPQLHQMSSPHVLTNAHHPHLQGPNVASNNQHQAYVIRIAKEKHIQQQRLFQQHQQQQFSASSVLTPHVQGQPQLNVSSPQNSSQSQTTSPQVSLSPLTTSSAMSPMSPHPQKHHIPPHIVARNPQMVGSGSTNQAGKQRQRQTPQQQFQQSGRHHPQQRHQSQSQHQVKILKGLGRGNMMHQNLPTDNTLPNGPSNTSGSQTAEKGERSVHMIHGKGLCSGPGINSFQAPKPSIPSHISLPLQPQQKMCSGQTTSSKQHQQTIANSEGSNLNHVSPLVASPTSTSSQTVPSIQQQQHQQSQLHQKSVNQTQPTVQRSLQPNLQVNSEHANKIQGREAHTRLHPSSSLSQMASSAPVANCVDVANIVTAVASASTQGKASDSNISSPATPVGSAATPHPAIESLPSVHRGIEHIQFSGSLPHLGGHDGAVQWSEEASQLQPPTPPSQLDQQQEGLQPSQNQSSLLQGGGSSS